MGIETFQGSGRLGALALRLAEAHELRSILALVADEVCTSLSTPDCVIYLVDNTGPEQRLVQSAAWGTKNPTRGLVLDAPLSLGWGEGIVGAAAATRTPQRISDTKVDDRHVDDLGSGRSELAVPILIRDDVVGVIDTEHPEVGHYGEGHLQVLRQIAALASLQLQAAMADESMRASVAAHEKVTAQLSAAVMSDPLTGVANRRAFDRELSSRVRSGALFWTCLLDLDGFKDLNDAHGHQSGDEALKTVAYVLESVIGTERMTFVARTGGDEFSIITSMGRAELQTALESMLGQITSQTTHIGHLSASVGIASGADREVLRRADDAMLIAKELGGNRVVDHATVGNHLAALEHRRSWRERAKSLVTGDDLHLEYQPIVALDPQVATAPLAFEALLRITDGHGTTTADLVEAVTRYRLDQTLDKRLLLHVLDVLQVQPGLVVAHNWSRRSFDVESGLVTTLLDELDRRSLDPSGLIVEITEHAGIENPERFQRAIRELRSHGVRVALDDLGAGWSSFKFLSQTPVDIIKLDGEWTQQICTNTIARELVTATVRCAGVTGAVVVAEWIETIEQLETMRDLGVEWGQGYLLSPPAPLLAQLGDFPDSAL